MLTRWDSSTTEPGRLRLALIDGLTWSPHRRGTDLAWHVHHPVSGKCFRVGVREYAFISLLDGHTTVAEGLTRLARSMGATALTSNEATTLCRWLLEAGLVTGGDDWQSAETSIQRRANAAVNPLWVQVPLPVPARLLSQLACGLSPLFSIWGWLIGLAILIAGGMNLAQQTHGPWSGWTRIFSLENWLNLFVAWCVLKLLHELSHALVCRHHGGTVRDWGLVFIGLAPSAYVDVSSAWMFRSRWPRIHTAAAGMWTELVIAGLAACCWRADQSQQMSQWLGDVILMASVSTLVFNANPLMRLDGYYILADALDIPNLSQQARSFWVETAKWVLTGQTQQQLRETGWRRGFVMGYGIAAGICQVLVCLSIAFATSVLFSGAGVILTAIALVAWFFQPLKHLVREMLRLKAEAPMQLARGVLLSGLTLISLAVGIVFIPWPGAVIHSGIVEYADVMIVRAAAPGFLESVLVTDGQLVEAGAPLMELRNDELAAEVAQLLAEAEKSQAEQTIHREKKDFASAAAEEERLRAIETRFQEQQNRLDSLKIHAARAGRVIVRHLSNRVGSYFEEGAELLIIGDDAAKEVQVAVPQRDWSFVASLEPRSVKVAVPERSRLRGEIAQVEPNASLRPLHPALCAPYGGPLAVKSQDPSSDANSELRLVEPCFRVTVRLPEEMAGSLTTGQLAKVSLGHQGRRVGDVLRQSLHEWHRSLQLAGQSRTRSL